MERGPALARNLVEQAVGNQGIVVFGNTYTADAIMRAIKAGVRRYAKGNRFAIPMAAHIVVASKR